MNTTNNIGTNIMIGAASLLVIILVVLALVIGGLYSIIILYKICVQKCFPVCQYIYNTCCCQHRRRSSYLYLSDDFVE